MLASLLSCSLLGCLSPSLKQADAVVHSADPPLSLEFVKDGVGLVCWMPCPSHVFDVDKEEQISPSVLVATTV